MTTKATISPQMTEPRFCSRIWAPLFLIGGLVVASVMAWQAIAASGVPNPLAAGTSLSAAVLDIAVLVFREGLECVLVLAAITAGINTRGPSWKNPIVAGDCHVACRMAPSSIRGLAEGLCL